MTTIRLLANVGDDVTGTVLSVSEDRARRLIRTGYAEVYAPPRKPSKQKE